MKLIEQDTMSGLEFRKDYLPKFSNIKINLVDNPKFYNLKQNIVTLFKKEITDYTYIFIELRKKIYFLKRELTEADLRDFDSMKGIWKGVFDEESFCTVSPEFINFLINKVTPVKPSVPASTVTLPENPPVPRQVEAVVKPLHAHGTATSSGFTSFIEKRIEQTRNTLGTKSIEYHRNGNPFHNFDRTGAMNHQIPERALWGFVSKQITSVLDLVEDIEQGKLPSPELIFEKTNDVRVYMFLLEGLMLRTLDQHSDAA